MKICIYNVTTTCGIGGNETFSIRLGEFLGKRGHDVCVVGGTPRGRDVRPVINLETKTFDYTETDRIIDIGSRFRKLAQRMLFARKAASFVKDSNFDVIHIFKPYDFITAFFLRRMGIKAKIVARFGGLEFYAGDRIFARDVDYIYSNSLVTAEKVSRRYSVQPLVIRNGIDEHLFKRTTQATDFKQNLGIGGIGNNELVILFVGRLVGWKGIDRLLQAFHKVCSRDRRRGLKLLIVGEGEYRKKWESLAGDLNIADKVIFTGAVAYKELPAYYSVSDIYVQPSIGEESCPNSVFEAMSSSLPVIATDNGGTKEIVRDNETGCIVRTGDVEDLAAKIERLLDADTRKKMGENGRLLIEREYSMDRVVDNFLDLIGLNKK